MGKLGTPLIDRPCFASEKPGLRDMGNTSERRQ